MQTTLADLTVAFLVAPDGTEQVELTEPWQAVLAAGGTPHLVSTQEGTVQAFHHLDRADTFPVDAVASGPAAARYGALVLPGGVANPDFLRTQPDAVAFARSFFEDGKPVAVICHGAWTLVEADVVRGRTLTSWPSLRTDIENAGGIWIDEAVHVDGGPNALISSRNPQDLELFCAALVEQLQAESVRAVSARG